MTRKTTHNEVIWLYPVLSRLGVTGLEANLSGGGDSGSIDDITFFKGDEYVQQTNEQDSVDAEVGVEITVFHAPPGTFVKEGDPLFEIDPVRVRRDLQAAQDLVEELRRERADLRETRTPAEERIAEIEASVEAELVRIANLSAEAMLTTVRAEGDGFVTWTNTDLIRSELEEVQEAVQIAPLSEIELILSHLTIDDGTKRDHTFWTALEEMIEREAIGLGNFYDNEGGSVWLKYALNPENAEIEVEESSFVENEPEYDYEDEEDDLDDEIEP